MMCTAGHIFEMGIFHMVSSSVIQQTKTMDHLEAL